MWRLVEKTGSSELESSSKAHHILRVHPLLQRLQLLHIPPIDILQWRIICRISWKLPANSLPLEHRYGADPVRALLHRTIKRSVLGWVLPCRSNQERREAVCTIGRVRAGGKVVGQVGREVKVEGVGDVARGQFWF